MPENMRAEDIFADAWGLYDDAVEILATGKLRVAAEVAWGATKRATDGLVLARTGREPGGTGRTSKELRILRRSDAAIASLFHLYKRRIVYLHGHCFYDGDCTEVFSMIEDTSEYIRETERLAGVRTEC